jgi:hypothetical protein
MNIKRLGGFALAAGLLTSVWLTSCATRYTDVSGEPGHAEWVGQRCVVLKGLRAYGFTLDLRRKDITHEVDVTTLPIGGPETTFKVLIPKGATLVVTSVRKCWNCPFDRISYGVEIPDIPELAAHKVFARSEVLGSREVQCTKNSRSME